MLPLYNTGPNMTYMLYVFYLRLKDLICLRTVPAMTIHSGMWHDLCSLGLRCCEIMIV